MSIRPSRRAATSVPGVSETPELAAEPTTEPTPELIPGADAAPDVAPEAWSGVHRGPLRAGEWVRLLDGKGRRHNICLEAGKRFFSNRGHFEHDELIGREEGFTVPSSA